MSRQIDFDESTITTTAKARWFKVNEIEALLNPQGVLPISTSPPSSPPPSGSLFLYDRAVTRNYKDDGYEWVKKRNSPKVREDHVKLRFEGKCRVAGCYVHCVTYPNMHRRAYHLLNPETGAALQPLTKSPLMKGPHSRSPCLILIHYLDTEQASNFSAEMVKMGINLTVPSKKDAEAGGKGGSKKKQPASKQSAASKSTTRRRSLKKKPSKEIKEENDTTAGSEVQQSHQNHQPLSNWDDISGVYNFMDSKDFDMIHKQRDDSFDMTFDEDMLDVLRDIAIDEDQIEQTVYSSISGHHLTTTATNGNAINSKINNAANPKQMTPPLHHESEKNHENVSSLISKMPVATSLQQHPQLRDPPKPNQMQHQMKKEEVDSTSQKRLEPLPDIVDITPDIFVMKNDKKSKIILSCSDKLDDDYMTGSENEENSAWHRLAAFVDVKKDSTVHCIDLCLLKKLNPFSYKGTAPQTKSIGARNVLIVGVLVHPSQDPTKEEIAVSLGREIQDIWKNTSKNPLAGNQTDSKTTFYSYDETVHRGSPFIKVLSQLSTETVEFIADPESPIGKSSSNGSFIGNTAIMSSDSNQNFSSQSEQRATSELPAPPPAMALVATVLSDFPNPPAEAVVPPQATVTRVVSANNAEKDKSVSKSVGEISVGPRSEDILSKALESTVKPSESRKRSSSSIEVTQISSSVDDMKEIGEVSAAASAWANNRNSENETKAEEVDRHCKIRFVEKLTNVIAETDHSDQQALGDVSDIELKAMDDDKIDGLIDSMLVRIVESLVEMSASSCEIQEELNSPDKSGFALLHYAALYNLQALIPVLLSRGANTDVKSVRGGLTPLHLACGAGNFAITELLVRQGCLLEVKDSFGFSPADHAIRNGFPDITEWLNEKIGGEKEMRAENRALEVHRENEMSVTQDDYEEKRLLIQSAFSNLSLKDKLTLNLIFKKKNQKKNNLSEANATIMEAEFESSSGSNNMMTDENVTKRDNAYDGSPMHNYAPCTTESLKASNRRLKKKKSVDKDVDIDVISDSDKESLDVAMTLMNEKDLEDLELSSSHMDDDLKNWMLRRNYETLKEASMHLQNTLRKHKKVKEEEEDKKNQSSDYVSDDNSVESSKKKLAQNAAMRSLKNMKSQAIAGLVIRKNMSRFHKRKDQK